LWNVRDGCDFSQSIVAAGDFRLRMNNSNLPLEGKLMVRSMKILAVALTVLCGSAMAEQIANPVYDAWKKAGKGASVTTLTKSEAMGTTSESETKTTVVEVTDEKATLEIKMTATVAGQKMDMPASKIDVPAKVDSATQTTTPAADPKATQTEEKVTVPAGTFNCKVQVVENEANGMKTKSKIYLSDEVPGGLVKSESTTEGAMASKAVTELTKIEKP
jgi:protein-tyrosine-phosphatase